VQLKCQPLCVSYVTVSFSFSYNECFHSIILSQVRQTEKYLLQPTNSGTPETWLLEWCLCNSMCAVYKNAAVIFHKLIADIHLQLNNDVRSSACFKMNLCCLLCLNTECNDFWSVECGTSSHVSSLINHCFLVTVVCFCSSVHRCVLVLCFMLLCHFPVLSTAVRWYLLVCVWSLNPTPVTTTHSSTGQFFLGGGAEPSLPKNFSTAPKKLLC